MWTEDKASFHGQYYDIEGAINEPKGVQQPHIPLWIGGGGEKVTLKLAARWGNATNFGNGNLEIVRQKMAVLRRHCEDLGRDFDSLTRSTGMNIFLLEKGEDPEKATERARGTASFDDFARGNFVGTAEQIAERIEKLANAGINYIITYFPRVAYDQAMLHRFAKEVMPQFQTG
jgi:alkanesulfonate monooxygenase SsuD/methylene tetrahydromethanopterin reductase-like flavin-dependent oxidoreductase (luciferase family)